jgi:outer membrane protein
MRYMFRAAPVALALVLALSATASAQSGQKLAFIRSTALLEAAPGRAEAEAQFEKETAVYGEQIKRMNDSLNTMISAYEKVQGTLSATARDTRGKEIQARGAEYERRTGELRQKAQARQQELVAPIYDKVKLAIEDVRAEGGFSFIFNFEQNSPILAADKNLDVTDRVIAKLRTATASGPAKPGAPAAAPAGVVRPQTPPRD